MGARSAGDRRNTALGVPAAAQTSSKASRSSSTSTTGASRWPTGGTPPIAKPVLSRTKSGSARLTVSPIRAATFFSSTRLAPLATTSTGRPLSRPRNTSDFAIWSIVQPIAAAASAEVRVPSGNSRTSKAKPRASSAD